MKDKECYNALVKHAHKKKLSVRNVSSKRLVDYAGMNPLAAKDMHFRDIKKNEILLDKKRPLKKRVVDLRHELIEMEEMKKNGNKYFPAHRIATRKEKRLSEWEKHENHTGTGKKHR